MAVTDLRTKQVGERVEHVCGTWQGVVERLGPVLPGGKSECDRILIARLDTGGTAESMAYRFRHI